MKSLTVDPKKPKETIRYASREELWEKKYARMKETLGEVDPEELRKFLSRKKQIEKGL